MDGVKVWCSSLTSERVREGDSLLMMMMVVESLEISSLAEFVSLSLPPPPSFPFLFFSSSEMEQKAVVRNNNRGCFARSDRWPRPLLSQNYDLPLPMTWPIPSHLLSDVYMLYLLYLCVLSSLLFFSPFFLPFIPSSTSLSVANIPNLPPTSSLCPFLFLLSLDLFP